MPGLSSEEDCLEEEEEEEAGEELREELGTGEECLESDKLSSRPESFDTTESCVFCRSDLLRAGWGGSAENLWYSWAV